MAGIFVLLLVGGFIALLRAAQKQRQRRMAAAATVRFVVNATGVWSDDIRALVKLLA